MPCPDYVHDDLQKSHYNGYKCSVEVLTLFVHKLKGEIIHSTINYPGLFHDSKLASYSELIYPSLSEDHTPARMVLLCDSAFLNRNIEGIVDRSRKTGEMTGITTDADAVLSAVDIILQLVMPSER